MSILPLGDIVFDSKLGLNGITGTSLLGPVTFSTAASGMELGVLGSASLTSAAASLEMGTLGGITLSGPMATFSLAATGSASMEAVAGEVSISTPGFVTIKGLTATLKEILDTLVDEILGHTHLTGTGPSGPPMPPATANLALLKSLKIGLNFE